MSTIKKSLPVMLTCPCSQFIKNKGGNSDARVTVEYKGAALHNAMMIPLDFFSIDLRKRLVNKVRLFKGYRMIGL